MLRWNGWGDVNTTMELPKAGRALLNEWVGEPVPSEDYPLEKLLEKVPATRLPEHPLLSYDKMERLVRSHGQSLPDWVAMRGGGIEKFPDAVAFPETTEQVGEILAWAKEQDAVVIPYGGGTSVVGHLTVPGSDRPVLSLSLERLNRLLSLDTVSQLAFFEAGVCGPDLEAQLAAHGYTLGHYPQSFERSTLGGWIVTRSSGQQSMHYGRIEALFAGGEMVTPRGVWELPLFPASAAGPDLRQMVLGSEGRLGVVTRAAVRVSPLPEFEEFYGAFFPSWKAAYEGVRALASARLPLCMIRLSNHIETITNMALSGHDTQAKLLNTYLGVRGVPREEACMILYGFTGNRKFSQAGRAEAQKIIRAHGGVVVGSVLGKTWNKKRFLIPYLRNTLWDAGYAVETLETAVTWDKVTLTMQKVEAAIKEAAARHNEKVHIFTHLSHLYSSGSSVYTSFVFRPGNKPEETMARWRDMKTAASQAIVEAGGTISHQHGVGTDHAPFLPAEKGELGMEMLRTVTDWMDEDKRYNPGKLLD